MLQQQQSHWSPERLPSKAACPTHLARCALPVACHTAGRVLQCVAPQGVCDVAHRVPSCTAGVCRSSRGVLRHTPSPPPPRHEWRLTCCLLCLHDVACPRSGRMLCSPARCVPYPVLLRGMPRCAVPRTRPPLPPAAAPGSSCDPPGMCLGNYSPDGTRGHGRELGEAEAEGGPRPRSRRTGQRGHAGSLRTGSRAGGSCQECFSPLR